MKWDHNISVSRLSFCCSILTIFNEFSEIWIMLLWTLFICCCFFLHNKVYGYNISVSRLSFCGSIFFKLKNFLKYEICCCRHCLYVAAFFYMINFMKYRNFQISFHSLKFFRISLIIWNFQFFQKIWNLIFKEGEFYI